MTNTWDDLRSRYPRLIPEKFGFECELGWLRILDGYFAVIDREMPVSATYELRQVKEKLGTLRIHDASYSETLSSVTAIIDAHRLAEARSLHICDYC